VSDWESNIDAMEYITKGISIDNTLYNSIVAAIATTVSAKHR